MIEVVRNKCSLESPSPASEAGPAAVEFFRVNNYSLTKPDKLAN